MGSKAVCPHAILLPVSTENRTVTFRALIWVKQMAFEILSNAEECGYSPRVADRTSNTVGKPHCLKLLLNEVLVLIGRDVHLIRGRSWRGVPLHTTLFLCNYPKEAIGLKDPRCFLYSPHTSLNQL